MIFIVAFLLLVMSLPVQAADWYVSPNVAHPNNGGPTACTQASPCNWMYAVDTKAGGSDRVRFNDGVYLTPTHGYETERAGTSSTARLTLEAINPRQATIRYAGPGGSGLSHGVYISHSNYTVRGLVIECRSSGGDYASDCFQVRGTSKSAMTNNVLFDNIFAKNAGHGMFHCTFGSNIEIKYSTIDQSGLTNSRGEALYLGSSNGDKPCTNFFAHNNVFSRFSENAIDFKDQSRTSVAEMNIFADQRTRTTTDEEPAGTCGTAGFVANTGVTAGTTAAGNYVRRNMIFRGLTPRVFYMPDPHRFDSYDNMIWGWDPCDGASPSNPELVFTTDIPDALSYNNIHCKHSSGDPNMSLGTDLDHGNPPNLVNRAQSECSSRITQLLGVPSIANCEIGQVAGNKTMTLNLQANTNGPVSGIGNTSNWTVTYSGTTQTINSVSITANNKMQIVMASQPASSSVPVTVDAAAGTIKNSAFLGKHGDCTLSVDAFKTDYGATDSQHKFPNPTPGIGGGVCGISADVAPVTCTNTVGGTPPPDPPPDPEGLNQAVWRFYGKDNAEGQVPLAPENTDVALGLGSAFRWRAGVRGGTANAVARSYELGGRFCNPTCGAWAQVTSNYSTTGVAYRYDAVQEHLTPTTNQLSLGGKTFIPGVFIEDSASTPSVAIATTQQIEWEFALVIPSTNSPLVPGDTVELRIQHTDGTAISTYNLPAITIAGGLTGSRTGSWSGMMQ